MRTSKIENIKLKEKIYSDLVAATFFDFSLLFSLILAVFILPTNKISTTFYLIYGLFYLFQKIAEFVLINNLFFTLIEEKKKSVLDDLEKKKVKAFSAVFVVLSPLSVPYFLLEFLYENIKNQKNKLFLISKPFRYKLFKVSQVFFSPKTQKEVFQPIISDWDEEIFEALKENKDANLFMINVRNTYGFIMAMWQKSPLGDLLEYVRKSES